MKRHAVEFEDELLVALGTNPQQFEREARLILAAKLFEQGRLTSSQAARLANMPRVVFLLRLHEVGVSAIDLDREELEEEFRHAEQD